MAEYKVKKIKKSPDISVVVPGSKSITNRALLLGALCEGESFIRNPLFSDDTTAFTESLEKLGFSLKVYPDFIALTGCAGKIPKEKAEIYVGSAGTAARFLTAFLGMSKGQYKIDASPQMQKRPMQPLFDALEETGARFTYEKEKGHLPVSVCSAQSKAEHIQVESDISTQFLSALLMVAPLATERSGNDFEIYVCGSRADGSYVKMTRAVMESFGVNAQRTDSGFLIKAGQRYQARDYRVEPDVSAACYFYAAAAVTGGSCLVKGVYKTSLQGDIKFLYLLEKMGASLHETPEGIRLCGPPPGTLKGIDADMKDFSDQVMTLAAIAPFCTSHVRIRNVAHIRNQESNRISAVVSELTKLGIKAEEYEDGLFIEPGLPKPCLINTYEDHRMAMAFAITGLMAKGIVIDNYECCSKTFKNYFKVFESIYE